MKLTKQERIAILVIAVIIILAVSTFMFIVPRFNAIASTTTTLANKQIELQTAIDKSGTKEQLKTDVINAYDSGASLADMFFEELKPYQADHEFNKFINQCEANVIVDSLTIGSPEVSTLAPSYFEEDQVTYDLKTYVTQGIDQTEEQLAAQARQDVLRQALGTSQDVGSITVDFTVTSIDMDELIKFCDEVNNYIVSDGVNDIRKAIKLNGFTFTYPDVSKQYEQMISEIETVSADAAITELYKNAGLARPAKDNTAADAAEDSAEELNVTDYIYSVTTSITFYSVERMLNPIEQLEAQDSINA